MENATAKTELWAIIQKEHPELAAELTECKRNRCDFVPIDQYPAKTNKWLLRAIHANSPALSKLIKCKIEPDLDELRSLFNAKLTVRIDDLIPALIEYAVGSECVTEESAA